MAEMWGGIQNDSKICDPGSWKAGITVTEWGVMGGAGLAGKLSLVSGLLVGDVSRVSRWGGIHHSETQRWTSGGAEAQLGKLSSFRWDSKD